MKPILTQNLVLFLLCWMLMPCLLHSQNIVPNPSFEDYAFLPSFMSNSGFDFERASKHWSVPNEASTDLINPRFRSKNLTTIPPRSGKNMAGIVVNGDYWAEYARVKLRTPLEVGKEYYVEYWISMPTYYSKRKPVPTLLNDHFGILFDKQFYVSDKRILKKTPQIKANNETLVQPNKWIKLFGSFVATEKATHLYIGQFLSDKAEPEIVEGYFFLDDVYVESFTSDAVDYVPRRYYNIKGSVASVIMENIYFETDEYVLLAESFVELDKLVNIMKKNPALTIEIQGHTDDHGSLDHNLTLSENRAKTVHDYLVSQGIAAKRLESKGYGLSRPVTENTSDENRQKNRRVEFVVNVDPELESTKEILGPEFIYRFSDEIPEDKRARQSFIGQYQKDWTCRNTSSPKATPEETSLLSKCKPQNAKKYILERAKTEKAIFINEYPEHPQNRAFFHSLLEDLRESGFNYLAFEGLDGRDQELQERGYPVINTGYYAKEPVYGDLIRTALELGFEFFIYEPNEEQIHKAINILSKKENFADEKTKKLSAKNWARALNITRLYKKDPQAKVVVFTSRGNVRKTNYNGVQSMTDWYRKFSQITPLCIDQARMTEKCKEEEEPLFRARNIVEPTVFMNRKKVFVQTEVDPLTDRNQQYYDIQVFHPPSQYQNKRPTWLLMNGKRKAFLFNPDKHGMNYPCLLMAYQEGEDINFATPIDAIELKNDSDAKALMLSTGTYTLVMRDKQKNKKLEVVVE